MTEQTKTVVVEYRAWAGSGNPPRRTQETITYPADCRLHFDCSQQTLQIKTPSGEDVAVFRGLSRYTTPGVVVESVDITEPAT